MVVDDPTIPHGQNAFRRPRHAPVVAHDDDRRSLTLSQFCQKFHNLVPRCRVEAARWLVGQDEPRIVGQRPGHSHALALSP